jgi:hypothetical protein
MRWPELSSNPNAPEVQAALRTELLKLQMPALYDRNYYFGQCVAGKSALDIGIVDHDVRNWESPAWLHPYIRKNAEFCLGIDTDADAVEELVARGYEAVVADATSDAFLGRAFDVIVAGELIEHLAQVKSFLSFCQRHSHCETRLLLSTPNPHYLGSMMHILRMGMFVSNAEHVAWISPSHVLELCRRTAWRLESYSIVVGSPNRVIQRYVIPAVLARYRATLPEWLGYGYVYVLARR